MLLPSGHFGLNWPHVGRISAFWKGCVHVSMLQIFLSWISDFFPLVRKLFSIPVLKDFSLFMVKI